MARTFSRGVISTSVDAREIVRAFSKLPKEVQNEIRNTNLKYSGDLADEVKKNIGVSDPPQADLIESTVKAVRDRNIKVSAGGPKKVGKPYKSRTGGARKYRAPAGLLIYGAEHGSSGKSTDRKGRNMGPRFVRAHNKEGYFMGPALRDFAPVMLEKWKTLIQREIKKAGLS